MTDTSPAPALNDNTADDAPPRILTDAARRALAEAAERRAAAEARALPEEHGGPRGLEPTRYGDWEKKGLAIDF